MVPLNTLRRVAAGPTQRRDAAACVTSACKRKCPQLAAAALEHLGTYM